MHLYRNELDVYVERLNSELSKKYKKVQFKIIGEVTNYLVTDIYINIDIRILGLHKSFVVNPETFTGIYKMDQFIKESIENIVCSMLVNYFIN